jgi:hypothetical protein
MKNIIRIILITTILFTGNLFSQTTLITQVYVNNQTTVTGCSTIDFGSTSNNNVVVYFKLTKPAAQAIANFDLKLKFKYSASSNGSQKSFVTIQSTSWANNNTTYEGTISCNISESEIQVTGSSIYIESNPSSISCEYPLKKIQLPVFNLSPTTASVGCGSNVPITFSVANVYNSPGTLSYIWYTTGWKLNGVNVPTSFTTTTNSISLTPASSTALPGSVYVYAVLNGVQQSEKGCTVTRTPYTSEATITGQSSLCSSSTYGISSLPPGTIVTNWSIQGSSNAILSATSGSTTTLTKYGNGAVSLTATLQNTCG